VLAGYHGSGMAPKAFSAGDPTTVEQHGYMGFLELLPLAGYEAKAIASLMKKVDEEI
jgi:hypothetical protein